MQRLSCMRITYANPLRVTDSVWVRTDRVVTEFVPSLSGITVGVFTALIQGLPNFLKFLPIHVLLWP